MCVCACMCMHVYVQIYIYIYMYMYMLVLVCMHACKYVWNAWFAAFAGFSALNKLLGKNVYTSQDQLGGPQVMVPNGVTHQVGLQSASCSYSLLKELTSKLARSATCSQHAAFCLIRSCQMTQKGSPQSLTGCDLTQASGDPDRCQKM